MKPRFLAAVICGGFAALLSRTEAAEPAPLHPEDGLVYSTREWEGTYVSRDLPGGVETTPVRAQLRLIAGDGSGDRALEIPGERSEWPAVSADGRRIYFQAESAKRWHIARVRADGTGLMTIAPTAGSDGDRVSAYGFAVAADGGYLTYTLHDGVAAKVVFAQADGSEARVLAPDFGFAYMASPDAKGERVVFSGPAQGYRLAVVDVAGGAPRMLTPEHPESYAPQFTPDGRTIVFIRRDGGLYRVAPDGTALRQMASGVQVEFFLSSRDKHGSTDFPAIAPNGRQVAFVGRDAAGVPNIFIVGLDGSDRRQVTQLAGTCGRVRWSPDGRWLAFVSMVGDRPQLFVVPADGSAAPRQLTDGRRAVYALSWLPTPR